MKIFEQRQENGSRKLMGTTTNDVASAVEVDLKTADGTTSKFDFTKQYHYVAPGSFAVNGTETALGMYIGDTRVVPPANIDFEEEITMTSIEVTPPTKVVYTEGDTLDLTGMVVTGNLSNGKTIAITEGYSATPADGSTLTTSNNKVVIMYYELTDEFTITVEAAAPTITPTAIEVTTKPTKLSYTEGEALDLTGMVVTLTGTDGTQEITETLGVDEYLTTPVNGAILTTDPTGEIEVVVSAYDLEDSFTITVATGEPELDPELNPGD